MGEHEPSKANGNDRHRKVLAALLGVPAQPNAGPLEVLLEERRRRGLHVSRPPGAAQSVVQEFGVTPDVELGAPDGTTTKGRPAKGETSAPTAIGEAPSGGMPRPTDTRVGRYLLEGAEEPLSPEASEAKLARDLDLRRQVLCRVLPTEQREQLLEDCRLHARLEHPNIQAFHDFGVTRVQREGDEGGDEVTYAIQMAQGVTGNLGELLLPDDDETEEQSLFRSTEVCGHVLDVLGAIDYAHRKGVARGGITADEVSVGPFGEVTIWDWSRVCGLEEAGGERAREQDLDGVGNLVVRALEICPSVAPLERLERALDEIADGRGSAARLAAALSAHLERAVEIVYSKRDAQREFEQGRGQLARWFEASRRFRELSLELAELDYFAWDAARDPDRFARYLEVKREHVDSAYSAADARTAAMRSFRNAVRHDPSHHDASDSLAALHWECLEDAHILHDPVAAKHHLAAVARYDRGSRVAWIESPGRLQVTTNPEGARVTLYRYVGRYNERVLVPEHFADLGTTPTAVVEVPQGSYSLLFEREGYPETRQALLVRPGFDRVEHVELLTREEMGEGMVYVPAGPFLAGGTPDLGWRRPVRERVLPSFLIGRVHVTLGEYLEYLRELHVRDPDEAARRQPRANNARGYFLEADPELGYRIPSEPVDPRLPWTTESPVIGLTVGDCEAYLRWFSERSGIDYELPPTWAWEKAARGVDGRLCPWGNAIVSSLTNVQDSAEQPRLRPVGATATDSSPYGVLDMGGNAQDYCSREGAPPGEGVMRGGAFSLPGSMAESSHFRGAEADTVGPTHSFRLFRWV